MHRHTPTLFCIFTEKEHQKQLERARKEQRKAERGELRTEQEQHDSESDSAIDTKDMPLLSQQSEQPVAVAAMHNEGVVRAAHSMTHDVSHSEPVKYKIACFIYMTFL